MRAAWIPYIGEWREVQKCESCGRDTYCLDPGDGLVTHIDPDDGIEVIETPFLGKPFPEKPELVSPLNTYSFSDIKGSFSDISVGHETDAVRYKLQGIDVEFSLKEPNPELDAFIARIASSQQAASKSPWLPMETAPRDGTEFLLMTDCNGVVQAWWEPADDDEDARSAGWVCANDAFDIGSDSSNLLGWMPLPTGTALMKSPDQVNA